MLERVIQCFFQKLVKIKDLKYLLSFNSINTSTEAGRSQERYRRSFLTTISTISSKFITTLIMIISVPLTINYLGTESFGLWMTISSVLLILNPFADLGLGVSYMNKISESIGKQNYSLSRKYTSNAFFILFVVAFAILFLFSVLFPLLNWTDLFKLKTPVAILQVNEAMVALVVLFAIGLPLVIVEKFQEGNQEGYFSNIWQSIGTLLSLGGILLVVYFQLGLTALIYATLGFTILSRLANFIFQFYFKKKWAAPRVKDIDINIIKSLLKTGVVFFLLNIFQVIGYSSDNFIISNILGVEAVALYGVVQKLSLLALIFGAFTNSLWPAYTEALAIGDYNWVKRTIKKTIIINLGLGILIGTFITTFGSWIIYKWTGGKLLPSTDLLLGFSFFIIVNGLVGSVAIIYNSSFILKWQLPLIIVSAISSIILKVFLCKSYGISGVVWATVISYTLFYLLPSWIIIDRLFLKKILNQ